LKYRILNNNSLEFFDATANNTGLIAANGTNIKISANNGVIELGDTASDVQVGTLGTAINWTFLGGGTIGTGGINTLSMGQSGDTVNMNVAGVTYQYPSSFLRFNEISGANNKINITTQVPGSVILTLPNRPVVGALTLTDSVNLTSTSTGTLAVNGPAYFDGEVVANNGIIIKNDSRDFAKLEPKIVWRRYSTTGVHPTDPNFFTAYLRSNSAATVANTTFVAQGTTPNITAFTFSGDNYLVEFSGYIYANTGGVYTFGVNSDDNSDCFIDGKLVADWYVAAGHGPNASGTPGGNQRTIYLNQGYHRIYTRFAEVNGGDTHEVCWRNPSDAGFSVIPTGQFYHHPTDLIMNANDNILLTQSTLITNTTNSVSNTTGALIVSGGMGITGNLFMSAANNYFATTTGQSYRLGWTDNYFQRDDRFSGMTVNGTYFAFNTQALVQSPGYLSVRTFIHNDSGNGTVIFASGSPVRLQNTAASTSNTTGSLIVDGGIGVTGNTNIYNTSLRVTGFNNLNAPVITNPSPSVDLVIGRAFTTLPGAASGGSADLGFQWGSGGYRHYISTRHNSGVVEGNEFNFWLNSGGAAGTSTSPGTGNQLAVTFSANTVATSNSSGAVRVNGGIGVSGNVYSNTFITSINTSSFNNQVRFNPGPTAGIVGPRIEFGIDGTPDTYMNIGAYNGLNNFDTNNRNFRLGSPTVTNIMLANATTGVVTFASSVIISGNLTVVGNVSSENVQSLSVADPLIKLGIGNYTSDLRDIGFAAHYNDGTNAHTGIIRDAGTKEYYVFQGYTPELDSNNNVIITDPSFRTANLNANFVKGNLIGTTAVVGGIELSSYSQAAYAQANVTIGVDASQNARMVIIEGTDVSQNARMAIIEGTNASQNVRLDYSNTALTIAQGVDNSQNVRLDFSNTAITIIQGVNTTQNTNIAATDGKMQLAYNTANNAVANLGPVITTNTVATVIIANTTASTSNSTGALIVSGGLGVAGNIFVGGTSAGSTGVYTDILRYSANGQPWSFGGGGGSIAITNDTTNSTTLFPLLSTANSGTLSTANTSNTKLYYVPSTGTLNATVFNSLSDAEYKENIITITDALNTVNQIDGVSFSWKDNGLKSYGVVAQELEKILPELVNTVDNVKSVNYSGIIAFLINSVKELDARVKQLESK